jgi:DNA repair protein RadC
MSDGKSKRQARVNRWPASERPRERLIADGAKSLTDAELIGLVLHTGSRGRSAVDLARALLTEYGGLAKLLSADSSRLQASRGIGAAKAARLCVLRELSHRHLAAPLENRDVLECSAATRDYFRARYRDCPREVFSCLFLDNKHHVVKLEELSNGTIDSAAVYPREVVKRALHHNAAAVILAHNHPSGVAEPSGSDLSITQRLVAALATIDVRVLDHLVIGHAQVVSMAERGQL